MLKSFSANSAYLLHSFLTHGAFTCLGFAHTKSITFAVDSAETALQILAKVKIITFAESLGGPESLITLPATQTHADVSKADREKLGITDSFLRMSVGLENANDLIRDLEQAMV